MARSRSMSAGKSRTGSKKKTGKRVATPPPPPVLIPITDVTDLNTHVLQFEGSALLAVVSPACPISTDTVVPYMEKLNGDRPPSLSKTNLVLLYTTEESKALCAALEITRVPYFCSYAYGRLVHMFSGDNMDKVLLIAKIAAQETAAEEAALLQKAKLEAAAALEG